MRELLIEVFAAIKGNKMRIALTGFSIGWGIFIFIVLISSGQGLLNGMKNNFKTFNVGVVTVTPRQTSQPFEGRSRGRSIHFYEEDITALKHLFGDTVTNTIMVMSHAVLARSDMDYVNTVVDGFTPGYAVAPNIRIVEGRDINDLDMQQQRMVCVIPKRLQKGFFGRSNSSVSSKNDTTAVGQELLLDGICFRVVGVYEPLWLTNANASHTIIAPLSTVKKIWCHDGKLSRVYLQTAHLTTAALNQHFSDRLRKELATRKNFAPTDKNAVKIDNYYELPVLLVNIMGGLDILIIMVSLATLISGIVGVSNIMLIAVRERTREIGIRRAMGAKAYQIVMLVLTESVIIFLLFGYIGMVVGLGLVKLSATFIDLSGNYEIFSNPSVRLIYVLAVSGIMIIAGLLAGYIPSRQAIRIKIVDALTAQ